MSTTMDTTSAAEFIFDLTMMKSLCGVPALLDEEDLAAFDEFVNCLAACYEIRDIPSAVAFYRYALETWEVGELRHEDGEMLVLCQHEHALTMRRAVERQRIARRDRESGEANVEELKEARHPPTARFLTMDTPRDAFELNEERIDDLAALRAVEETLGLTFRVAARIEAQTERAARALRQLESLCAIREQNQEDDFQDMIDDIIYANAPPL